MKVMFHYLFIGLKISLFLMSSSHDPVIRMFYCLFIVLKISLFSISCHDPVIRIFQDCFFIVLKISLFFMSSEYVPLSSCCFSIHSLMSSSHYLGLKHQKLFNVRKSIFLNESFQSRQFFFLLSFHF